MKLIEKMAEDYSSAPEGKEWSGNERFPHQCIEYASYLEGFKAAREMAILTAKEYCSDEESCGCEAFKIRTDIRLLGESEVAT